MRLLVTKAGSSFQRSLRPRLARVGKADSEVRSSVSLYSYSHALPVENDTSTRARSRGCRSPKRLMNTRSVGIACKSNTALLFRAGNYYMEIPPTDEFSIEEMRTNAMSHYS